MTNYYELLAVAPTAPPEEIKQAFRAEIARYHPDKVQHLGKEFRELAATRATELTEAYRTLMNAHLRADYDRQLQTLRGIPTPSPPPGAAAPSPAAPASAPSSPRPEPQSRPSSTLFSEERSTRDVYVRQATLGRIRQVVGAELGPVTEVPMRGFDLVYATSKARMFGKTQPTTNFFVRIVRDVNREAVRETWTMAEKALGSQTREALVILLGPVTASREISEEVAALPRPRGKAAPALRLIPVDIRDWSAKVPPDISPTWRTILEKLKKA